MRQALFYAKCGVFVRNCGKLWPIGGLIFWRMPAPYFPRYHKMIWNFYTYIPEGAEEAAQRADFPGRPAYGVLKISSPDNEKIGAGIIRQL